MYVNEKSYIIQKETIIVNFLRMNLGTKNPTILEIGTNTLFYKIKLILKKLGTNNYFEK